MVTPVVKELVRNGLRVVPEGPREARSPSDGGNAALELIALVQAARDGDQRAWEHLVRRLEPLVRGVARGFRLPDCDIDDVVQKTWLKLLENIDSVKDATYLPGWLATTTRRMCLNAFQANLREVPSEDIEVRGEEPSAEDVVIAGERSRIVRKALADLPQRQRTLVTVMTQGRERPYAELANVLQMPVGSIGPTYGRAVQRLREHGRLAELSDA